MSVPKTIGLIMDGNRRFAVKNNLNTFSGHQAGYKKLEEVIEWAVESRIENVIVYAFSTENWNRKKDEVGGLMKFLEFVLTKRINEWRKKGVDIGFIGDRSQFSPKIQKLMQDAEKTKPKKVLIKVISAQSYGGRNEMVRAINKLSDKKNITEETFSKILDTKNIPDPDLIIRTGGEMRLSNFLLWQSAYSELFFTKTLWPDFSKKEFLNVLKEYAGRERRNGK